jgi:hypothetical protein
MIHAGLPEGHGLGDPRQRFLCDSCATDGLIRSQFTTTGQRIELPPLVPPRDQGDDGALTAADVEAGRRATMARVSAEAAAEGRRPGPEADARRQARHRHDDLLLLAAVRRLTEEGRYRVVGTDEPAAGLKAAEAAAGLTQYGADRAAARLVAAGKLRRIAVTPRPEAGTKRYGRAMAGLQLVTAAAAPGTAE